MSTELQVREGSAADSERVLELVRLSLGVGTIPRGHDYWAWKHYRNPFGESPVLLAEADGELVGLRVFMRWQWQAGGQVLDAVRAVDTATHPRWQGRGIFSRLTKALVERMRETGVHFIFNTPNEKSRPGYLKMGWSAVGRTDLWIRPVRPLRIARGVLAGQAGHAAANEEPAGVDGIDALCEHAALDGFLDSVASRAGPRLYTRRTRDYLRWRYGTIPGFRYHALFELDGRNGAALVFRYKTQAALREARICELLVGPSARSRAIARALLTRLQKTGWADYISAMAPVGDAGILLRRGFLPAFRLGPILTVRALNTAAAGPDLLVRDAWALSIGDLELF